MKKLTVIVLVLLLSTAAYAGFLGFSGTTNLGTFTGVKCSTGLTCTKTGGNLQIVSSPTLTGTTLALSSTLSAVGNFSVNTSKFTVAGATGNTHVLGDFDIATNKFTVAAASGNTLVAGTFNSTGAGVFASTLESDGDFSVATNKLTVAASTGNTVVAGTLGVTGASTLTGGVAVSVPKVNFMHGWQPAAVTTGTSATPSATELYVSQVYIPMNATITGIKVNNAATCGTNKYVVALFNAAGAPVANSALAGTMCSGTDGFQTIAFTGTYAAKGPGMYWIGIYLDGTTDRYRAIPAIGAFGGYAGKVTGQTFGTVASVTLPTGFTADLGPVAYTY